MTTMRSIFSHCAAISISPCSFIPPLSASAKSAFGARVRVVTGGRVLTQELVGAYGHKGIQHEPVLTFGLGASCTVDAIEVRWPDAAHTVERFVNVGSGRRVRIVQGQGVRIEP